MKQTKSHYSKVELTNRVRTLKQARSQLYYIRKYKTKPSWKDLSIARRMSRYVIVGKKRRI